MAAPPSTPHGGPAAPRRVFVVDDHALTRSGYRFLLAEEADLALCGEAASADEALARIPEVAPDVVVSDVALGAGPNGIELVKHLHAVLPELPVLIVSMHAEALYAERALRAGARGYVMKTEVEGAIVEAIRHVMSGSLYVSPLVRDLLLGRGQPGLGGGSPAARLTDRELEVFALFGRGLTTKEVAEALHLSPKTVETHRGRIKEKLGAETTAEFVHRAVLWMHAHEA
jgi:DNA-binding NarL/FixJ family response regulator